jgi:endonuclease YncB( thermonuclease family)
MAETKVLTDSGYKKLLTDLRSVIAEGKRRAARVAGQVLVETYWQVGKRILEEKLSEKANYGDSIVADLAEDLGMDEDTLRRSVDFYEAYKIAAPRSGNLTWSHYKALLGIPSPEERRFYERQAGEEGWTKEALLAAIRRDAFREERSPEKKESRGKLKRPTEPTYIYKAVVERIIDGDTLILRIDLGFQVWKEQRIRLAGIDCPPIDEPKGYEAFEYVRDQLARVPFVMVRTHKIDVHGRYIGDVFYSFSERKGAEIFQSGRYLNQDLLDRRLARLV